MKFKSIYAYLAPLVVIVGCGSSAHERDDASMETPNEDAGIRQDMDTVVEPPPADAGGTPAGDHCDDAPTLATTGTGVTGTTVDANSDYVFHDNCAASFGATVVYRLLVPGNQRALVAVDPVAGFDVVVGIARACSESISCVASADTTTPIDATETVSYTNTSSESESLYVFVRSFASSQDAFRISASLSAPLDGDICGNATTITAGTLAGQTTLGYARDFVSSEGLCPFFARGPDRMYRISVPAGRGLRATVSPDAAGTYNPTLAIVEDEVNACEPEAPCLAGANSTEEDEDETASFFNASGEARSVLLIVSGEGGSSGEFLLETALETPAAGDRCTTATPLATGTLVGQTTTGFTNDYDTDGAASCRAGSGPDRVYAIDVPSTKTLTITATPEGFDIAIALFGSIDTCDGTNYACAASVDSNGEGLAETLTYRNTAASTRTVYVSIDGFRAGDFMLETNIE